MPPIPERRSRPPDGGTRRPLFRLARFASHARRGESSRLSRAKGLPCRLPVSQARAPPGALSLRGQHTAPRRLVRASVYAQGSGPRIARRLRRPCATLPRSRVRRAPLCVCVGCRRRSPLRSFRRGALTPSLRSVARVARLRAPRRGYGSIRRGYVVLQRACPASPVASPPLQNSPPRLCWLVRSSGTLCRPACHEVYERAPGVEATPPAPAVAGERKDNHKAD